MRLIKTVLPILLIFQTFSGGLSAQTVADLVDEYQRLAKKYYITYSEQKHFFGIDARGISTYNSYRAKVENRPECRVYWNELAAFQEFILSADAETFAETYEKKSGQKWSNRRIRKWVNQGKKNSRRAVRLIGKPLSGRRIALDPGHTAGDMEIAKLEGRFIEMKVDGELLTFCEGDLTLTTAKLLKQRLEKLGARVMISRPKPNTTAEGLSIKDWLSDKLSKILDEEVREKNISSGRKKQLLKFKARAFQRYFVRPDLEVRAKKINKFRPDLTLVLHFNADAEKKKPGPSPKNYNMIFVPGSFLKHELDEKEERMHFLRLLAGNFNDRSAALSRLVLDEMSKKLKVPPVPKKNNLAYLNRSSIYISKGIYARNLGMCRLLNGPVSYIESFYQDNAAEAKRLAKNRPGKPAARLIDLADAYAEGVMRYFKLKH